MNPNHPPTNNYPFPLWILAGILQRIWFCWHIVIFVVTGIVATLIYFLIFNLFPKEKAYRYTCVVTCYWGWIWFVLSGVRVKTEGFTKIDPSKPYISVSNHLSAFDIHTCSISSPLYFSFLAKIEVDKIPFIGYLARNMHVYVDRKSVESRQKSLERMVNHLQAGRSIHLYVEGTRNKTEQPLKSFHDGAFRLAIETQTPLYVATIIGSNQIMNSKEFRAMPTKVRCIWEEPIITAGMTLDDVDKLKEMVRAKMMSHLRPLFEIEGSESASLS